MSETILIVDIEGTCCDDDSLKPADRETIEIGAVVFQLDERKIIGEFSSLIRPVRRLTEFCTKLTGISQADVDVAAPFGRVWMDRFIPWVGDRTSFCSWGPYDLEQLSLDCGRSPLPFHFKCHCDLSVTFLRKFGKRRGNRGAMNILGIPPHGSSHRGLDDARNIARIVSVMLDKGALLQTKLIGG